MAAGTPTVEAFVKYGLLPENLPPSHSSESVWSVFQSNTDYLGDSKPGQLARYSASKRGNQRRIFSIPHPNFIYDQARFLVKNWSDVQNIMNGSAGSLSKPIFDEVISRAIKITPHSELPAKRMKKLARYKYCLVADVARFYPSLYTHCLPWAFHGKNAAKNDRSKDSLSIYANRLDFALRQAQDGQTIGIPVGPDTSRVVSEILLSAIDAQIAADSPEFAVAYVRHVDDYWVGGESIQECQSHLHSLRRALHDYELDVNEVKTKIVSTSQVFAEAWPLDLERRTIQEIRRSIGPGVENYSAIFYLGKIIDYVNSTNDDALVRHIIRRIDRARVWDAGWDFLEAFLIHCAVQFPHSFDRVARVVAWRSRRGLPVDVVLWSDVIARVINQNADLGHDSEVLWALWLAKEIGTKIPSSIASIVIKRNSGPVIGYLAHFHANGMIDGYDISNDIVQRCGLEAESRYWPAILELCHLEIAGVKPRKITGSSGLKSIFSAKKSLVVWNRLPAVFEMQDGEADDPAFAIEDDDFAYDGDEDDADDEENPFIEGLE